jgi:hypothetical protein
MKGLHPHHPASTRGRSPQPEPASPSPSPSPHLIFVVTVDATCTRVLKSLKRTVDTGTALDRKPLSPQPTPAHPQPTAARTRRPRPSGLQLSAATCNSNAPTALPHGAQTAENLA